MIATEIRNMLVLVDALRQPFPSPDDLQLARFLVTSIANTAKQPIDAEEASPEQLATVLEAAANRAVFQAERQRQIQRQQEQN